MTETTAKPPAAAPPAVSCADQAGSQARPDARLSTQALVPSKIARTQGSRPRRASARKLASGTRAAACGRISLHARATTARVQWGLSGPPPYPALDSSQPRRRGSRRALDRARGQFLAPCLGDWPARAEARRQAAASRSQSQPASLNSRPAAKAAANGRQGTKIQEPGRSPARPRSRRTPGIRSAQLRSKDGASAAGRIASPAELAARQLDHRPPAKAAGNRPARYRCRRFASRSDSGAGEIQLRAPRRIL